MIDLNRIDQIYQGIIGRAISVTRRSETGRFDEIVACAVIGLAEEQVYTPAPNRVEIVKDLVLLCCDLSIDWLIDKGMIVIDWLIDRLIINRFIDQSIDRSIS